MRPLEGQPQIGFWLSLWLVFIRLPGFSALNSPALSHTTTEGEVAGSPVTASHPDSHRPRMLWARLESVLGYLGIEVLVSAPPTTFCSLWCWVAEALVLQTQLQTQRGCQSALTASGSSQSFDFGTCPKCPPLCYGDNSRRHIGRRQQGLCNRAAT